MKKFVALCMSSLLLLSSAYAAPVYTYKESVPVSDSITLTKVKEFHSGHDITYTCIKADLTDENTSLKLLTPTAGIDKLDTVQNLAATEQNVVAALNADFFSTASAGKSLAIGLEVKDGKLIQSPINPGTMATVAYDGAAVAMSYLDFHIMAVAPNWEYKEVRHLNKHTAYYGDILMYTREFNGGYSPAPGGEVVEVVVSDGKIAEFRRNMPPVEIPEDGCVLVVSEGSTMFFANNFQVGDPIKFDYYITPSLENVVDAFGAGAVLVSEGKALSAFSHEVSGYNPRSALGIDKEGKTLYMVAVDGRQSSSRGMTMKELANLMESMGCYTAVNLDGGGSTNMLASTLSNKKMHTVNSPTENRKVINAVGLTFDAQAGEPAGIVIDCDSNALYKGESTKIRAWVHDENLRPVDAEVTFSASSGTINGNIFTADAPGTVTLKANYGNVSEEYEINVWEKVAGIETDGYITLKNNEKKALSIRVFDVDGNSANVKDYSDFKITSSDPSVVKADGNILTAGKNGKAMITVSKDGAVSYTSVTVGQMEEKFTETFEVFSGKTVTYPSYVKGNVAVRQEHVRSGKNAGKIWYNFTDDNEDTKAVYYDFDVKTPVADSCDEITVYAYSESDFNHRLKLQVYDGNGKNKWLTFTEGFEGGKWHKLTADIPDDISRPVKLDRIYAVYQEGDIKDTGSVYIDDLSFDTSSAIAHLPLKENKYTNVGEYLDTGDVFRVATLADTTKTLYREMVNSQMTSYVKKGTSYSLFNFGESYGITEDKNALYIRLNMSKGSIRASDSNQWNKIVSAVDKTSAKNVFVLSEKSVFGSNSTENQVFKDYFASLDKNVYVITPGEADTYFKEDGINYFTVAPCLMEKPGTEYIRNYRCLEFTFGKTTFFDWKEIY